MRLWVFDVPICRIGFVDHILSSYFLGSRRGPPWCYPQWAWFFRDKFMILSNKSDTSEAWRFKYKTDLYFSWCSFQTFYKKLTCLSCAAQVGEGGWENREEVLSNWRFLTQFLVKLCSIELSWECGDKDPSQLVWRWAGIFKSRIC